MVQKRLRYDSQVRLFKALMHPARLGILDVLRTGEACVCHLEAALGYRQAYLSQQLMVLREAGLVADRRDGWNVYYQVSKPDVFAVIDAARSTMGESKRAYPASVIANCTCPHCSGEKTDQIALATRTA